MEPLKVVDCGLVVHRWVEGLTVVVLVVVVASRLLLPVPVEAPWRWYRWLPEGLEGAPGMQGAPGPVDGLPETSRW